MWIQLQNMCWMLFESLISQFNCNHVFKTQFQLMWHTACTFRIYWYIIINTHNEISNFLVKIYIYIFFWNSNLHLKFVDWLFIIFFFFRLYVGPKWYAFLILDCVYNQSDDFYFLRILYIGPKPYNIYIISMM